MQTNVVFLVLDTLREDHSSGLRKLQDQGFTKYENVVSASNWTIPSHVSMFTGRLPSSHGVHESLNVYSDNPSKLAPANAAAEKQGILGKLIDAKYLTYSLTANPFISPLFGFPFKRCEVYDEVGLVTEMNQYLNRAGGSWLRAGLRMIQEGRSRTFLRRVNQHLRAKVPSLFYRNPLEKGSSHILQSIKSWKTQDPFMLFVNLMEAHQPYSWNDRAPGAEATYCLLTSKKFPRKLDWQARYRKHADLAVSRGIDIIASLGSLPSNTLFIVTSDHGQMLGEMGKYDHGYFLDDGLLRVPLFVRYPQGVRPFEQSEAQMSTCEIPLLIEGVLYGANMELGSEWVAAESFGPSWNVLRYARNESERKQIETAYRRKVKVYGQEGSFVLDPGTGRLEEREGNLSERKIADYLLSRIRA